MVIMNGGGGHTEKADRLSPCFCPCGLKSLCVTSLKFGTEPLPGVGSGVGRQIKSIVWYKIAMLSHFFGAQRSIAPPAGETLK